MHRVFSQKVTDVSEMRKVFIIRAITKFASCGDIEKIFSKVNKKSLGPAAMNVPQVGNQ